MEFKDYYKILGVSKNATGDQIKKEYRKLARTYHPDINKAPNAEHRFKEIGEAYEVLKDPEKRKAYDRFGTDWKAGQQQQQYQQQYQEQHRQYQGQNTGFGAESGFDFGSGFEQAGQYSEFFEQLFGGSQHKGRSAHQSTRHKGEELNASIMIPVEDAFNGSTRSMSFETPSITPDGKMEYKPVNLDVKIPKGIKNGQKIRLAGQGSPGYNGGEAGDLFITVDFEKHPVYRVEEADVYVNLPVAPWEAALGASVNVQTPTGNLSVKIPAGSLQGKKLRLKEKGIPSKTPGDLYFVVNIVLPPANDEKSRKVYESMKELNFNPRANFGRL